ncbi:MAG: trigger factor [Bacteroidia bacterium]|nr:trigger factor [Bacteroidia bacterium]
MNVLQELKENQTAEITIDIAPVDYVPSFEKELKKVSKQVAIKGFRQGAVPKSVVQKMHGKAILFDEINKLVSENLEKHLTDNNVEILGNPLPIPVTEFDVDFSNPRDYCFKFEIGLAPLFALNLPPQKAVPYYEISVDDAKIDQYIEDIRTRQGKFSNPEKSEADSILYGQFQELASDGQPLDGGINTKTTFAVSAIKDAEKQAPFIGLEKDQTIVFNPANVIGNNVEIGAMFNIKTDAAAALTSDFKFTIESINKREAADLNQELFDKVYGQGSVNSIDEFRTKVADDIKHMFTNESERKMKHDLEDIMLEEVGLALPDSFLKRWLKAVSEKPLTDEQIEKEYPLYARGLKLRLIENKIFRDQNMQVNDDEVKAMARDMVNQQFQQYGMLQGLEEAMDGMVTRYLEKKENLNRVYENLSEFKTFAYLKSIVNRDISNVTYEAFQEIVANHHH